MSAFRPRVYGVILAAGTSSRLGRPKQLLPLGGEPLLNHVLRRARASRLDGLVLVLGHDADEIERAVVDAGQAVVRNERFGEGQATSLVAGIAALPDDATGALVLLGDQPEIEPGIIDGLVAVHAEHRATDRFVQPSYGGVPGNPVLIGREWFEAVSRLTGDEGARSLIRRHRERVIVMPQGRETPPRDVDTDEDYRRLAADWAG